ncbi:MAG: hypothetical protein CVT64_11850 [Actinobacteria bacterium HGW-Actinobacteria-4]|nr:MAG: hypothetical protein CVT64_11850 [Actinobacteria bacterium HGW-Actinobacteria-4]
MKTVFFGAIGVALCWYFLTVDWSALHGVTFRPGLLALALVVALAFRYLGVVVWRLVLRQLGADALPPLPVLADIYAKAWLARYIPGTLPWIAGKVYLAAEHGIAKTKLAVSSVVEAGAQVVGVGALSLALLALDGRIADVAPFIRVVAVVGALALACVMLPPVFNRMIHLGARLVRRDIQVSVSWRGVGSPVALYAVGAVVSGLSYVAFSHAIITNLTWGDTAYLIGAFGLAGVVGMLTPLVPSGLGTRDSAQLLLLLVILPVPEAALLVLASRVWSALVDVVFWAVAAVHRSASKP